MINLDTTDKKIIYELDQNARQSATEIAKKLKIAKETANFRIKRLLKTGIIKGFYPLINSYLFNLYFYKVFFKLIPLKPARKKEILEFLSKESKAAQVLELEGAFDIQLLVLVKNNQELDSILDRINIFCGKEIEKKEILTIDKIYRFNQQFIYEGGKEIKKEIEDNNKKIKIDDIAWGVLKLISKNARMPILEIAKKLKISPQLAQYHLKKLIKDKVIVSTHLAIDYSKLDLEHYHIAIQLKNSTILSKLIQFIIKKRKSIFATKMIGYYDCSFEILIKDNKELKSFIEDIYENFSESINKLDIFMIYNEYELNLYPLE